MQHTGVTAQTTTETTLIIMDRLKTSAIPGNLDTEGSTINMQDLPNTAVQ